MNAQEFHAFLRELQQDQYHWPNRYFAWKKPDETLFMIGTNSTQFFHLLQYEMNPFFKEYGARLRDINPKVAFYRGGKRFDPVEELVTKVGQYEYLGSWDDPDILMDAKNGYGLVLACGRWALAKENIMGRSKEEEPAKPPLGEQIEAAELRSAALIAPSRSIPDIPFH